MWEFKCLSNILIWNQKNVAKFLFKRLLFFDTGTESTFKCACVHLKKEEKKRMFFTYIIFHLKTICNTSKKINTSTLIIH